MHLSSHLLCARPQALCSTPLISFALMKVLEEHCHLLHAQERGKVAGPEASARVQWSWD